MAEIKWTGGQLAAIQNRGETLLVSAAAGSGKTAVLTARIIARLTDPDEPLDISRLAVVTFTKAAAAELKERISFSLSDALRRDPRNDRLARQIIKLDHARISTIHSFCYDMIRGNLNALGLGGETRVADSAEMRLIRKNVMNGVIDGLYSAEGGSGAIANFPAFAENFISERDDRLAELFISLYDKLSARPLGLAALDEKIGALENSFNSEGDFFDNIWGGVIARTVRVQLDYYRAVFTSAAEYMAGDEKLAKNYLPAFEYCRDFTSRFVTALDGGGYAEARETLDGYAPPQLGRGVKKADQDEQTDFYKAARTTFNAQLKKLRAAYFTISGEQARSAAAETAALCRDVKALLANYEEALNSEKRRRSLVDFGDLERLAYKLLYDGGKPSAYAATVRQYYDEIYIDEYQDTNELQDLIFRAVSRSDNRFMVGDIKQSIYGFRGALPSLFSGYRDAFPPLGETGGKVDNSNNATVSSPENFNNDGATIFLSDNFRCDRPIIDFANAVFGILFTNNSGRVPYYPQDALIFSKSGERDFVPVKVVVVGGETEDEEAEDDGETLTKIRETDAGTSSPEARYVAAEVARLLGQGYRPGDIALLFRSAKNSSPAFEEELSKIGAPFFNGITRDFFENAEILLAMCLLNCIDNPSRDIYLAGALKSPVFGFTVNELAEIRLFSPEVPLYEALMCYTGQTSFAKGGEFLSWLRKYRGFAAAQTVDKLIWRLFIDTGLLSLASDGTARRNLMLLYDYARKFESGSFKGLYNFIIYINGIIEEGETLENAKAFSESDDTVKIMTVHQSKGLEFPVCFLCDASRRLNRSDAGETILCEDSLGIAMRLRDETGFVRRNTPVRQALSLRIAENSLDEEMRVLYVALTRARERLYVTAKSADPQKLLGDCRDNARFLSPYVFSRSPNYISWILTALFSRPEGGFYTLETYASDSPELEMPRAGVSAPDEALPPPPELSERTVGEYKEMLLERFSFKYPWETLSKHPAKLTVSRLYPGVLDEDSGADVGQTNLGGENGDEMKPRFKPRFLEPSGGEADAAERGTATHVFMQFCDFARVEASGVPAEIERLKSKRFITDAMASLVRVRDVERFFAGSLYRLIKASGDVRREVRFNINYPAEDFTADGDLKKRLAGEYILVQGVIDCFFELCDGTICLLDYKTDSVPREIRGDKVAEDRFFTEKHGRQLSYYRYACERLTGKKVSRTVIYSFALGREVLIMNKKATG